MQRVSDGPAPDWDATRIARELRARGVGIGSPLVVLAETGSTNDDAKRAAREGAPSGAAFVADAQTRGRGRQGHAWHSPPGENLYVSFVLRPALAPRATPPLALAAGLAVADAAASLVPNRSVGIKWPNDVLLDGRKLAGVLVEAQIAADRVESVVVGIGINVRTRSFPPDIASIATSLAIAGATELDRSTLFVRLAAALERRIGELVAHGVAHLVRAIAPIDALVGKRVAVDGATGVAAGIDAEGRLVIRGDDGVERAYGAGEVGSAG